MSDNPDNSVSSKSKASPGFEDHLSQKAAQFVPSAREPEKTFALPTARLASIRVEEASQRFSSPSGKSAKN
jgi:hypothetical protein